VRIPGRSARSQLRQSSACRPRLLPISSCHSSSTTACSAPNSSSALALASIRLRIRVGDQNLGRRAELLRAPACFASSLAIGPITAA
jgi:hypothetical protein